MQSTHNVLGIRPPEYCPRLSYIALIMAVDLFVLADTFQYSRQSFQNRTRLRTPQGWQWISVPLKGGQHGHPIREVEIDNREPWMRKHWRSLEYNYRSTPFFEYYEPELRPTFEREWTSLGDLTSTTVETICTLLEVHSPVKRASNLAGNVREIEEIAREFKGTTLLVPEESYAHDASVLKSTLVFAFDEPSYRQNFEGFESDMSALDLLFNYGPEARSILREGIVSVLD